MRLAPSLSQQIKLKLIAIIYLHFVLKLEVTLSSKNQSTIMKEAYVPPECEMLISDLNHLLHLPQVVVLCQLLSNVLHVVVVVVVVGFPTPSEGWGHGGRPWSPRSWSIPQGLDQRS